MPALKGCASSRSTGRAALVGVTPCSAENAIRQELTKMHSHHTQHDRQSRDTAVMFIMQPPRPTLPLAEHLRSMSSTIKTRPWDALQGLRVCYECLVAVDHDHTASLALNCGATVKFASPTTALSPACAFAVRRDVAGSPTGSTGGTALREQTLRTRTETGSRCNWCQVRQSPRLGGQ